MESSRNIHSTPSADFCMQLDDGPTSKTVDGGALTFTAQGHSSRLLDKIASLRREDHQLCDVILELGPKKIYAHRVVLSACSKYFCAMFTNTMLESRQETVILTDLDGTAVEDLVEFSYTSHVNVHEENVQQLLKAACVLQFPEVACACSTFLSEQLHPSNCLGIASFAEVHGCTELKESSREYILDNFGEVIQCDEYHQLGLEEVKELLCSDYIRVTAEEQVFEAMHKWLTYNLPKRQKMAHDLLCCIRLPLLKPLYLVDQVYGKDVYHNNQQCVELIMQSMVYHTVQEKRAQLKISMKDQPRKGTIGTLFAIGGMDTCHNKGTIECFNARKGRWNLMCHSPTTSRRLQFGIAVIDSKIYIVGGRNGLRTLNSVDCYDPATNAWDSVTPMCSYRHGVGVGVMFGPMYAVGGHDGWSYLSSVERYDPNTRQWSFIASMFSPRSTAGVAVLDGKLYVVGGRDSNACLNTVECYDPHTNKWSLLPHLNVARGGVGVTMLDNRLYALGGHEITNPLKSVEVFDPKINEWTLVAPMQRARDAVAAVTVGKMIYAVGGFDGRTYLNSVEYYDPEEDVWKFCAPLNSGRAGAGVILLPKLVVDSVQSESPN